MAHRNNQLNRKVRHRVCPSVQGRLKRRCEALTGKGVEAINQDRLEWLLEADPSIRYQTSKDLMGEPEAKLKGLRALITEEGWGYAYLLRMNPDCSWGDEYYKPKWTCTHYTLLELRNLETDPSLPAAHKAIDDAISANIGRDGGINPSRSPRSASDVCINGMFLRFACYFKQPEDRICTIIDFLLASRMGDGGFNCQFKKAETKHGSLHTTLSVCEGLHEYIVGGYGYRRNEVESALVQAQEFMLLHRLYKSDRTGEIIDLKFLEMRNPTRWRYDILKALDYLRYAGLPYDARMEDAILHIKGLMNERGRWKLGSRLPGERYFDMERQGADSRWITLKALRVLKAYGNE